MNLQTIVACIFLKLIKVNCRQENIGKQHSLPLNKMDQFITFETLPSTRETCRERCTQWYPLPFDFFTCSVDASLLYQYNFIWLYGAVSTTEVMKY